MRMTIFEITKISESGKMQFYKFRFGLHVRMQLLAVTNRVLKQGQFVLGNQVAEFENKFANSIGVESVIGCANGLDALKLALRALDLSKSSLIAVPAHTFFATWLAILEEGHIPVGVDVDLSTGQMSLESLQQCVKKYEQLQAVIYVHMHGIAGELGQIAELCAQSRIALIEDCAQAHGLNIDNRAAGSYGEFAAFSFYPTKNLPAFGDAGCVATSQNNEEKLRILSNYGWKTGDRDKHWVAGLNSRMDSLQAAFLNYNFSKLLKQNQMREKIAKKYNSIQSKRYRVLGINSPSVWHHYVVLVKNQATFRKFMLDRGIPTQVHYQTPCHLQPLISESKLPLDYKRGDFPNTEYISSHAVSIPLHPWLKKREITRVINSLKAWSVGIDE